MFFEIVNSNAMALVILIITVLAVMQRIFITSAYAFTVRSRWENCLTSLFLIAVAAFYLLIIFAPMLEYFNQIRSASRMVLLWAASLDLFVGYLELSRKRRM